MPMTRIDDAPERCDLLSDDAQSQPWRPVIPWYGTLAGVVHVVIDASLTADELPLVAK